MASTFSDMLRLELQASGENQDTWGTKLNEAIHKLESAIAGRKAISLTSSDVTLTTNNGGDGDDEQAAAMILDLSGTVTAEVDIIAPNQPKMYIVHNGCDVTADNSVNIRTADGDPLEIPEGETNVVWCDGDDNFRSISASLSGNTAGTFGEFTGTLTGLTTTVEPTVKYRKVGDVVTLTVDGSSFGTSNNNALTMTGLPVELRPDSDRSVPCLIINTSTVVGRALVGASGTITFSAPNDDGVFTAVFDIGGSKGLSTGWTITYMV